MDRKLKKYHKSGYITVFINGILIFLIYCSASRKQIRAIVDKKKKESYARQGGKVSMPTKTTRALEVTRVGGGGGGTVCVSGRLVILTLMNGRINETVTIECILDY